MTGRMYTVQFSGVSVSAVQDLFLIQAPTSAIVRLHEVHITDDTSETSEQLPFSISRLPTTVTLGSGGTVPTPAKFSSGAASAASTVHVNDTTRATTSGSASVLVRQAENMLNGFHWVSLPESVIEASPSQAITVGLEGAPGSARTMSGWVRFEEIGG